MSHPTQIFISNPTALRVEYCLDDARLLLWWSPLAGQSTDCLDRNYSSRDAHLDVFASIHLPDCTLGAFRSCDYDPYHCVLHFEHRTLHLALPTDTPALLLWSDQPLTVDLASHRFDTPLAQTPTHLLLRHPEPRHTFHFAATLAPGDGRLRHCPFHFPEQRVFTQACLAAHQPLALGVGLEHDAIADRLHSLCTAGADAILAATDRAVAPHLASGRTVSSRHPELVALRDGVIRGLHSMIDNSGAYRASLKAIYYLIWVRDGGFSYPYQAAAGWPHKLPEFCRFLLDNPKHVTDSGLPQGRMFGQLIHRTLGKLEEDGLYYVVWSLFTHWTQHGHLDFVTPADWALLDEALAWVEAVTWDAGRGLHGEYTADETPTHGARDQGWDFAIGKPAGDGCLRWNDQRVTRNYDVYFNVCMHSTYTMLAALRNDPSYNARAARILPALETLLAERHHGIPCYGELVLEDGSRVRPPHWGPAAGASCCVWGLAMPNFLPLADWDSVRAAVVNDLLANPDMHFINGICAALNAVDPWLHPEEPLLELHRRLAAETARPGTYLPMGGAMPEKFNAPQGNLHHDIRPQGFAMGSWLAAWSGLGLRRLPHGLALRPTSAFERIESYPWRGKSLTFHFLPADTRALALDIDGTRIEGTLQLPEESLRDGSHIRLVPSEPRPLLLRSTAELLRVEPDGTLQLRAHGLTRLTFSEAFPSFHLRGETDAPVDHTVTRTAPLQHLDFTHHGLLRLTIPNR